MEKYRHTASGQIVEAIQLTESNVNEVRILIRGSEVRDEIDPFSREVSKALNVPSDAGYIRLSQGQYLVREGKNVAVYMPSEFVGKFIPIEVPGGYVPDGVRDSKILRDDTREDGL